jgi:peptidoglycan/LPS O-acetylase OafA/YrhL
MTMRYLWVFAAYIALRTAVNYKKFPAEYRAFKSQFVAKVAGIWCFAVTAACDILGMYDTDKFTMILKIATPLVLLALGLIMPAIAKLEQNKEA